MNANEFELGGKRYVAENGNKCELCAMGEGNRCYLAPSCEGHKRFDGRDVIFVEVRL